MSYNGSGTFNINSTGQPVVAGTVITASVFNALTADLATGLTTAITKDGQTTTTARIPFAQGINSSLVTDASSTSTGSIITAGGVGIAKALYVGTTANVAGAVTLGGIATFSAQPIFSSLTASSAVATDASKGLVSVTNTGTGNNVLATSPTLVTPILGTPQSGTLTSCTGLPNAGLVNSSITIGGTAIALGASSSTITNDLSISGLTVGKGGGALATNTAVGASALAATASGNYNSGFGYQALQALTSGNFNTACGQSSLAAMNTGSSNTALGQSALTGTTSGSSNVGIGKDALQANTTASKNTAVGYQAGYSGVTSAGNTFVGYQAGYSHAGSAGEYSNTFVGFNAGYAATSGYVNTFLGYNSGSAVTTGLLNTIVGAYTGNQNNLDIRTASGYVVLADGSGNRMLSSANGYSTALGNSAVPQSGTGITFPATQSASSDANTLDDYEEGTWTPGVTFSGGTTGLTYASQNGSYVKIGRFVYASFNLQLSNKGSSSGSVQVTGLPFTVSSSVGFGICTANTFSLNSTIQTVLQITNGGTVMDLKSGGTDSSLANTDFTNSTQIRATVVYTSA